MTYIAGNAYLRYKRANMRSDYLKMMEEIGQIKPPAEDEDEELDQMEWLFPSDETEEASASPKRDGKGEDENL